jgi:hypothetical protein
MRLCPVLPRWLRRPANPPSGKSYGEASCDISQKWLTYWSRSHEVIIPTHTIRMEFNLSCIPGGMSVVQSLLALWKLIQCPKLTLRYVTRDVSRYASRRTSFKLVLTEHLSVQCRSDGIDRRYFMLPLSSVWRSHWPAEGMRDIFFGGRPNGLKLCRDSNQLIRLKIDLM